MKYYLFFLIGFLTLSIASDANTSSEPSFPADESPAELLNNTPLTGPTDSVDPKKSVAFTEITSNNLELLMEDDHNHFFFKGDVTVLGENLKVTCQQLEIIAPTNTETKNIGSTPPTSIQSITAIGNVTIEQEERKAEAGKAIIYPEEGKVVLMDSPKIIDKYGTIVGHKMTLYKGQRKAIVEGGAGDSKRPRVILPKLPNLGYEKTSNEK